MNKVFFVNKIGFEISFVKEFGFLLLFHPRLQFSYLIGTKMSLH